MLIMGCPHVCVCRLRGATVTGFSGDEKTPGPDFCQVYESI